MKDSKDIISLWRKEEPIYKKWGEHVLSLVKKKLNDITSDISLQICSVRTKSEDSLSDKINRKGKEYKDDLYKKITDKVGVRFVVFLEDDLKTIRQALYANRSNWNIEYKRNVDECRQTNPENFSYLSDHYIVENKESFEIEDVKIPQGTPCEIQVRTLLQHAFEELEHYYTYKKGTSLPEIKRHIAKCRALLETTADYHQMFAEKVKNSDNVQQQTYSRLIELYENLMQPSVDAIKIKIGAEKSNMAILNSFDEKDFGDLENRINDMLKRYPKLISMIKKRGVSDIMFRQPVILFAYLMVDSDHIRTRQRWNISEEPLRTICSDLDKPFDRS